MYAICFDIMVKPSIQRLTRWNIYKIKRLCWGAVSLGRVTVYRNKSVLNDQLKALVRLFGWIDDHILRHVSH